MRPGRCAVSEIHTCSGRYVDVLTTQHLGALLGHVPVSVAVGATMPVPPHEKCPEHYEIRALRTSCRTIERPSLSERGFSFRGSRVVRFGPCLPLRKPRLTPWAANLLSRVRAGVSVRCSPGRVVGVHLMTKGDGSALVSARADHSLPPFSRVVGHHSMLMPSADRTSAIGQKKLPLSVPPT